ncbi:hypothetical protein HMPREF1253_0430 [Peptoniphilus sp. BV3C26]|nr:hypothetical protein HMPREF1253_0430 [Peptoniphilus sp. BV3C26]
MNESFVNDHLFFLLHNINSKFYEKVTKIYKNIREIANSLLK